ncbi:MAG: DUF2304 domain-containing protein [Candidatus Woesearchaeota archaeon]
MITIIQIAILIFAVFAWSRAVLRMRDKHISLGEFSLWSMIWAAVIFVALFPSAITFVSWAMGIERGVDLAIYASIILLFYLMFRLYVRIDNQNKEITTLVRELSLKNARKKK